MKRLRLGSLLMLVSIFIMSSAVAGEWQLTIRGYGGWHSSTADWSADHTRVEVAAAGLDYINGYQVDLGSGSGFGGGVEYRLSGDRFGIEVAVLVGDLHADLEMTADELGGPRVEDLDFDAGFRPAFFGLNYHPFGSHGYFDPYVGIFLCQMFYGDADIRVFDQNMTTVLTDASGVGLNLGVDVALGRPSWVLSGGLRYLMTGTDFAVNVNVIETDLPAIEVDVDPYIWTLGLGHRF